MVPCMSVVNLIQGSSVGWLVDEEENLAIRIRGPEILRLFFELCIYGSEFSAGVRESSSSMAQYEEIAIAGRAQVHRHELWVLPAETIEACRIFVIAGNDEGRAIHASEVAK